jgi:hypothetical protein
VENAVCQTSVLLDRQALTMRNLAIAAALVILIQPEAIMGASFQLSFAAVAALVAVYEARVAAWGRDEPLGKASIPPGRRRAQAHGARNLEAAAAAGTLGTAVRDLLRDLGHGFVHGL